MEMEGRKVILPIWHELNQSDILRYSPTLADKRAAKSSDGVAAVARSLVQVIRPAAFDLETSCADARRTISRVTQQLKENAPEFEYRVTPAQTIPTTLPVSLSDSGKRLIGSAMSEGLRIDVIAPDAAAYNANPRSLMQPLRRPRWNGFRRHIVRVTP